MRLLARVDHRVLEPAKHQLLLVAADLDQLLVGLRDLQPVALQHRRHVLHRLLLEPPRHAAEPHVTQVLHPLEVRHRHAAAVQQQIRDHHHALLLQNLARTIRHGPVRGLRDHPRPHPPRVPRVDDALQRRRDEHVAGHLQRLLRVRGEGDGRAGRGGFREAFDGAGGADPFLERLDVDAGGRGDHAAALGDGENDAAVVCDEVGGPVSDVAEALDDEGGVGDGGEARGGGGAALDAEEFADTEVDAEAGGLLAAADAAELDGLAGDAGGRVDVAEGHVLVRVHDEGHFAGAGAVVRCGNVDGGADGVFLDEFRGEAARDAVDFRKGELGLLEAEAGLGAAEGDLRDRTCG
mmetsp:Transcript_5448/g.13137  ORF Transcript_5448/g.13137 Transcript_5448/m.13137 type:complete len:351 (+) Transcript_5448:255-1307(+)